MTFTAMKELTDLPVGGRVVVDDAHDKPWTKVDEEWMDNGEVRLRVQHFSGAVTSGHVALYDETRVRQWTVRHGGAHYSVAVEPDPEHEGHWFCLTFHTTAPATMYAGDPLSLDPTAMGEYIDTEPPWQEFAQALARQWAASARQHRAESEQFVAEQRRLNAVIVESAPRLRVANSLRDALRSLLEDEVVSEDEDPF